MDYSDGSNHMHCGGLAIGSNIGSSAADSGYRIASEYWFSPTIPTDSKVKVRFTPAAASMYASEPYSDKRPYAKLQASVRIKGKGTVVSTGLLPVGTPSAIIDLSSSISASSSTIQIEVGDPKSDYEIAAYCGCGDYFNWSGASFSNTNTCLYYAPYYGYNSMGCYYSKPSSCAGVTSGPSSPEMCSNNGIYQWSGKGPSTDVYSGSSADAAGAVWAGTLEIATNATVCL